MPGSPDETNDEIAGHLQPTSYGNEPTVFNTESNFHLNAPFPLNTPPSSCPPETVRLTRAPTPPPPADEGIVWMEPGAETPTRWHATRASRATRAALLARPRQAATEDSDAASKRLREVDEALMRAAAASPETTDPTVVDSDSQLAQSMSAAGLSSTASPQWPLEADTSNRIRPTFTSSFLRPGSKFVGTQNSDRQRYNVQVELKDVDMDQSFLCGYLRIQGLTDDHPTLTTYFEGEIIGNKHTFKTAHPEWGSSEKVDMQHWARFPAWRPLAQQAQSPCFTFKNYAQHDHLFMRWKEYFLVPDHKVKTITGASFEGFYYICFNQSAGSVTGIYFHSKSEKYQQLELEHVKDRGCMGAMEFR